MLAALRRAGAGSDGRAALAHEKAASGRVSHPLAPARFHACAGSKAGASLPFGMDCSAAGGSPRASPGKGGLRAQGSGPATLGKCSRKRLADQQLTLPKLGMTWANPAKSCSVQSGSTLPASSLGPRATNVSAHWAVLTAERRLPRGPSAWCGGAAPRGARPSSGRWQESAPRPGNGGHRRTAAAQASPASRPVVSRLRLERFL